MRRVIPRDETGLKDRTKHDMKAYHASIDWIEWWEDFYLTINDHGFPFYRTLGQFITSRNVNLLQRKFLKWYLGPVDAEQPEEFANFKYQPIDWQGKKENGGWYDDKSLALAKKQFNQVDGALQKLQSYGNGVFSKMPIRIEKLMNKIDEAYQGGSFVPGITYAENLERIKNYMALMEKALNMSQVSLDIVAKSLGINYQNMEGFAQLMAASATTQNTQATNRVGAAIEQLTSLALVKAATHGHPIPEAIEGKLIEVHKAKKGSGNGGVQ